MKINYCNSIMLLAFGFLFTRCCPTQVSESGKLLIKSYDELVKNQETNQCLKIQDMNCVKFYLPKGDLPDIGTFHKTAFTSTFRTDTSHFTFNAFQTPICTDSIANGLQMWRSQYSDLCPECFPDTTMLPKRKYSDAIWQIVIFVPVSTFKSLNLKKYGNSDFERLRKLAVSPQNMAAIYEPYLEPCNGYLSKLNQSLRNNRRDKKSITGIICKVKLRSIGSEIPCYVFNKESFGTSNPYLNWKKLDNKFFKNSTKLL